jgi:hypothetical protein
MISVIGPLRSASPLLPKAGLALLQATWLCNRAAHWPKALTCARPLVGAAQPHFARHEAALEPSLQAAGSSLEQSLKARAYIRGVENFPEFLDVWQQYFHDIPCAITPVPAKNYASSEGMIEINLIALKIGSSRKKEVV